MHWQVPADVFGGTVVPPGLTLDLYEGIAWVAVVPFWMSGITPRFMPAVSGLSRFPELNVRTYVTQQGDKTGGLVFEFRCGQCHRCQTSALVV